MSQDVVGAWGAETICLQAALHDAIFLQSALEVIIDEGQQDCKHFLLTLRISV
jgi:hypothetical protein